MARAKQSKKKVSVTEQLRSAGLRPTLQREAVLRALASTKSHPTAVELHEMLDGFAPSVSLATVYNTLEALTEAGLAQKLPPTGPEIAYRYDADVSEHVHAATPEGRWIDLPAELSERLLASVDAATLEEIERATGSKVVRVSVQLTLDSE